MNSGTQGHAGRRGAEASGVAEALFTDQQVAIAGVAVAVDGHVDGVLDERPELVEHAFDSEPDLKAIRAVDIQTKALNARDRRLALVFGALHQLRRVVEQVAEVRQDAQRDALFGVGLVRQIQRAQATQRKAGPRTIQAHAAGAVEQPQLRLAAKREDLIRLMRAEELHAQIRVTQHLQQLRPTLIV